MPKKESEAVVDATARFVCQFCDKRFKRKSDVDGHRRTHTGEKPFKCSFCPKTFGQSGSKLRHERIHSDDRPFECPHCPKRFREHGNLKTHVRTHTGERPYKCDECDRAFAQRSMLTRHMNTHAKVVGLLMCGQCHMTLPSQAKLDEHLRLHQDEDNLRLDCSYCNKKFRSAITLKNHTEDHVAAGDALRVDLVVAGGKGGKDAKRPLSTLVAAASSLAQLDNSENSNAGLPPTKRGRGNGRVASRHEETAGEEDKNAALADQPRVVAGGGGKGGRAARGRLPSTDLSSLLSESDCDAAHVMPSAGGSGGFAAAIAARRSNANKPQFNVSFDGIPSRVSLPVATPQPGGALLANGYHGSDNALAGMADSSSSATDRHTHAAGALAALASERDVVAAVGDNAGMGRTKRASSRSKSGFNVNLNLVSKTTPSVVPGAPEPERRSRKGFQF